MCGIAGRVNVSAPIEPAAIFGMTEMLTHRGPDDHGYHLRARAGLGHRRLSIIDRSGGHQPLANEDESVWIVFNGEIYNHVELRRELIGRGHRFATRCDTEAIVHAYEEWGPECVRRLRGMFTFAVWDERAQTLMLARDRLGIKPLYYAAIDAGDGVDLAFASEIKSLLTLADVDDGLDEAALASCLGLRYVPAPLTMLRGVKKLPPATLLTWRRGRIELASYWDLADQPTADDMPPSEVEAAAELRARLEQATAMRLMAEVPLGAFLSGGIDSTLITAAMLHTMGTPGRLKTFSVGYAEMDAHADDELDYARLAARALGTEHHEVRVAARDAAAALPQIVWHLDEPLADPACVPLYFLARRTRQEVTVVLSGEGADEALGGYYIYRRLARLEALRQRLGAARGLLDRLARWGEHAPLARLRRAARLLGRPLECYRGVSRGLDEHLLMQLHNKKVQAHQELLEHTLGELLGPCWRRTRGMTPLRRLLYLDTRIWLPDDILLKADKMTMAHALELRVPFLDHELMEHAWSLPDRFKVAAGVGKVLLRRAARGRVPGAILERPKRGFATPTAAWLRGGLRDLAVSALTDARSLARERFDLRFVLALLERHQAGADLSAELWPLVILELWHRQLAAAAKPRPQHAEVA